MLYGVPVHCAKTGAGIEGLWEWPGHALGYRRSRRKVQRAKQEAEFILRCSYDASREVRANFLLASEQARCFSLLVILYNLFPLLAGPFSRWGEHLSRAGEMGFTWVFVNPIHQLGASRSLYSIADYFRIDPTFLDPQSTASPEDQARQVITLAREKGLKVMIDLVVNHCAIDSPLTREHPEWFVREHDGKIAHSSCHHNGEKVVWKDLAQFDHEHTRDPEGLYRYCLSVVEHLLSLGFEGFRCDAAYQVPPQFWRRLMREIKGRHAHIVFLAETLGCTADQTKEAARAGFDFLFN